MFAVYSKNMVFCKAVVLNGQHYVAAQMLTVQHFLRSSVFLEDPFGTLVLLVATERHQVCKKLTTATTNGFL